MSVAAPTAGTNGVPMNPTRRTALVAGGFYLLTFVTSIPALALYGSVHNPDYVIGPGPTPACCGAASLK
jgi:hypothetical protein